MGGGGKFLTLSVDVVDIIHNWPQKHVHQRFVRAIEYPQQ